MTSMSWFNLFLSFSCYFRFLFLFVSFFQGSHAKFFLPFLIASCFRLFCTVFLPIAMAITLSLILHLINSSSKILNSPCFLLQNSLDFSMLVECKSHSKDPIMLCSKKDQVLVCHCVVPSVVSLILPLTFWLPRLMGK